MPPAEPFTVTGGAGLLEPWLELLQAATRKDNPAPRRR
jgi:hypothetical protein